MKTKNNKSLISKTGKKIIPKKEPPSLSIAPCNKLNSMRKKRVNMTQIQTNNYNNLKVSNLPSQQSHSSHRRYNIYFDKVLSQSLFKEGMNYYIKEDYINNHTTRYCHYDLNDEHYHKQNTNESPKEIFNTFNDRDNRNSIESMLTILIHYVNIMKNVYDAKLKSIINKHQKFIDSSKVYSIKLLIDRKRVFD